MKKRNKDCGLTLPDVKTDYKATVIKVVQNDHKDKQTNRTESLEMDPHIHSHLNYDKGDLSDKQVICRKDDPFDKQC